MAKKSVDREHVRDSSGDPQRLKRGAKAHKSQRPITLTIGGSEILAQRGSWALAPRVVKGTTYWEPRLDPSKLIIPIVSPTPEQVKEWGLHNVNQEVHYIPCYDHFGVRHPDKEAPKVALWQDNEKNTLEFHSWYVGAGQGEHFGRSGAWFFVTAESEPAVKDGKLKERYEMRNVTAAAAVKQKAASRAAKPGKEKETSAPRGKYMVFDSHPVTAVLRWMGAEGYDTKTAIATLTELGFEDVSPTTVSIQTAAGRKVNKERMTPRGPLPDFTEKELFQLNAAKLKAGKVAAAAAKARDQEPTEATDEKTGNGHTAPPKEKHRSKARATAKAEKVVQDEDEGERKLREQAMSDIRKRASRKRSVDRSVSQEDPTAALAVDSDAERDEEAALVAETAGQVEKLDRSLRES
jgi:hypothetical protein